jgi:hypothetical protein
VSLPRNSVTIALRLVMGNYCGRLCNKAATRNRDPRSPLHCGGRSRDGGAVATQITIIFASAAVPHAAPVPNIKRIPIYACRDLGHALRPVGLKGLSL